MSTGDALRYYIEEFELLPPAPNPLQVYHALWQLVTERGAEFPDAKIGAAWCDTVYPITFFEGNQDYYGIDIDLTSRLQHVAKIRQLVIDNRLFEKIRECYAAAGNKEAFVSFSRLHGPEAVALKGIPEPVTVYRAGQVLNKHARTT